MSNNNANIDRKPIISSLISSIGYNPNTCTLEVEFIHEGATYQYQNVSREVFDAMMQAESIGGYFTKTIKKHPEVFPYVRVS